MMPSPPLWINQKNFYGFFHFFSRFHFRFAYLAFLFLLTPALITSCSNKEIQGLPSLSDQPLHFGKSWRRVMTHFHSAYSWDACDYSGLNENNEPNRDCLDHLRAATCTNHLDYVFFTDHMKKMTEFTEQELLLLETDQGDEWIHEDSSSTITTQGNWRAPCADGFRPRFAFGFESKLLGLGLSRQLSSTASENQARYEEWSRTTRDTLVNELHALVGVPHTEDKTIEAIEELSPDFIEIYNLHANLDPNLRRTYLRRDPIQTLPAILSYLIDPFSLLEPDLLFLHFLDRHETYYSIWDRLLARGNRITGLAGNDAHENTFPIATADGERLDSYRRMSKFVSNHCLVNEDSFHAIKTAIRNHECLVVFEAMGTPSGFSFSAFPSSSDPSTRTTLGGTLTRPPQTEVTLEVEVPSLVGISGDDVKPRMIVDILHIDPSGVSSIISNSVDPTGTISVRTLDSGPFRVEISLRPKHLYNRAKPYEEMTLEKFPWISSNPLFVEDLP